MNTFVMNGDLWRVKLVPPNSPMLVDRTATLRVATTDTETMTVYLSYYLDDGFLIRVFIHELGHCALHSFNLIPAIHQFVKPEYWVDAEEWVCNFIADYGLIIFRTAFKVLGNSAWRLIPKQIERLVA